MAKMLKQLVFGQKKNPPAPPRPDYEGDKLPEDQFVNPADVPFFDHDYENLPKFKAKGGGGVQFAEKKEPEILVFENYSEPADLRAELSVLEADPLYVSPLDDQGSAPPHSLWAATTSTTTSKDAVAQDEEEEDMYCVPYDTPEGETAPPLPQACLVQGRRPDERQTDLAEDAYDVVPDVSDEDEDTASRPVDEYDEPWEWSVGARLTSSLQVSPALSLDGRPPSDPEDEDEDMMARQRRLYETAFDSRVKRDADDLDRLMQSPLFLGRAAASETPVARAASRSSFGSTSGSSASSTPTHQPMEIARQSPRHFTPTERRKVTLVRDSLPRSMSPQARPKPDLLKGVINQNYERKISFNSQWDSVSRCSSSDKSSSQESMNVELSSKNERNCLLGDPLSFRDEGRNLTSNYPNNWKELTNAKLENSNDFQKNVQDIVVQKEDAPSPALTKKSISSHSGFKVLPTDNSPRFAKTKSLKTIDHPPQQQPQDPELKENNSQMAPDAPIARKPARPSSLLSEVRPMDNLPQSPENDNRSSEDYDPPWDLKISNVLRPSGVNGSVSVPERLSSGQGQPQMTTSVTHDKLEVEETKDRPTAATKPNKPNGPSSRPNLNLNLNLNSDSPRKARQNLTLNFGCSALSAVGEKVDPQLTLEKQGWYHGSISRVDAEGKLRVLKEGSYLVRNSESSKQDYSLSLKSARGFMHMKIVPTSEGRFILGQFSNPFSSIPEMIQHYSVNKLPIKGAEHMSLLYPVIDQLL